MQACYRSWTSASKNAKTRISGAHAPAVELAASYRVHALPSPAACYALSERAAAFLKYTLGETRVPECGGDAAGDKRALEARLG